VPKLIGLSGDEAADRAKELDLVLDIVQKRHDPEIQSGHILHQDPPPGTAVMRGRKIRLVLSLGGEVLRVPLLLRRAERAAGIELTRGRLAPGEAAEAHLRDFAAGTIAAQVPQAGSPAVPGTRVYRLVSRGPEPARWVMPDLSGRPVRLVETWLGACGLRMGAVRRVEGGGRPPGTVLGQLPRAGYPVGAKDVVDLTVAR
jgi:serine/threonine-protein kinase